MNLKFQVPASERPLRVLSGLRSLLLVALMMASVVGSLASVALAAPGVITTVAGNGTASFAGDGGAATLAQLHYPTNVAVDSAGNLFIADFYNHRIRKVNTSGVITTVAGNGTAGFAGDGGSATSARLNTPHGVAVDSAGNLFIADEGNNRIRKVNTSGVITTIAGNGTASFAGDGGAATLAQLHYPTNVAVDSAGNLFIADFYNHRIRKVNTSGVITTVAGNGTAGFAGDGGSATSAQLTYPHDVAVDGAGNLFIADRYNNRIRKVNTSGVITTIAGNGTAGFSGDLGPATSARLNYPHGVAVDRAGNLFIADTSNARIRKVNTSGVITTVAGNGTEGFSGNGSAATSARLYNPTGVAVDRAGNLFIADNYNHRIRKVSAPSSSNNAPALADATFAATKGTPFSRQLVGTDADKDALTYKVTAGTLPVGLNLSASGLIAGTPTTVESQVVTVQVADGKGGTGTGRFVFNVRNGTVKSYVGQGIILIKGTWNASQFGQPDKKGGFTEGILYQRLIGMGYDSTRILVLDLSDSQKFGRHNGQETITESVRQIRQKILAWKTYNWGPDASVQVDIIAHSAGGLAARQYVNTSNLRDGKPLVDVRNVITLGTPLGGITGLEAALSETGVVFLRNPLDYLNDSVFGDMRVSRAVGNANYKNVPGIAYWQLGGKTPRDLKSNIPFLRQVDIPILYQIGGDEYYEYDGLVNVRSVRGEVPAREAESDIPKNLSHYRILKLNHSALVKDPKIVDPCILAILRGEGLDGCVAESGNLIRTPGSTALAAATAPSAQSQLVKVEAADLTGQTQKVISVPIDAPGEATFSFVARSTFRFTLTAPDGTTYTPETTATATATYESGSDSISNYGFWRVNSPSPGIWKLNIAPIAVNADEPAGLATVSVVNSLHLEPSEAGKEYPAGATPPITATLTENGVPLLGKSVSVNINGPDKSSLVLKDDGLSSDGAANDGVYGGLPPASAQGGLFELSFKATGNNAAGQQFQRIGFSSYTIAPSGARLTRVYSDQGLDADNDGVFEALKFNVGVNVSQAGNYLVTADLQDYQGYAIATAQGSGQAMAAGNRTLSLLFEGGRIFQHGETGPYKVVNIRLYADTADRPLWIETDNGPITTSSYTLSQFDNTPPAPSGPDFVVTVTTDADNGNYAANDISLREAITLANANPDVSVITFDPTVFGSAKTITLGGEQLSVTTKVSIVGPTLGVTINANGKEGALINSSNATLSNLNFTGANGFATLRNSGTLALNNCSVADNKNGSGVYNDEGTLVVTNSRITNNRSGNSGAGILNSYGTVTVNTSTFTNNVTEAEGGAISNFQGTLTLVNSTVSGNSAPDDDGGAISAGGNVTIMGSTISGNSAGGGGGAIFYNGDPDKESLVVSNSTLSDNSAQIGGAIYTIDGLTKIDSSTITGNSAPAGKGGGLANPGKILDKVEIINSIVVGNIGSDVDIVKDGTNTFVSKGHNLIGAGNAKAAFNKTGDKITTNAKLGPLQNNGGLTLTHAPLAGSPAIDAGATDLTTDQRGQARPQGAADDIGAVESSVSAPPINVTVSLSPNSPFTRDTLTATPTVSPQVAGTTLTYTFRIKDKTVQSGSSNRLDLAKAGNGDKGDVITCEVTATNASGTGKASAQVTVQNSTPIAISSKGEVDADTLKGFVLNAFDADGDPLTFKRVGGPRNGVTADIRVDPTDGKTKLFYKSRPFYGGVDVIRFVVFDSSNKQSNESTLGINVLYTPPPPANRAPIAGDTNIDTYVNTSVVKGLLGSDPDGDAITFRIVGNAKYGTSEIKRDNDGFFKLYYTSLNRFYGNDSVTYIVTDSRGKESNLATVRINFVNRSPVALGNFVQVASGELVSQFLFADDPDLDAITYRLVNNPRYGKGEVKLDAQGKWRFFYRSLPGYVGTDRITFIAIDPFGKESSPAAIDINVVRVSGPSALRKGDDEPSGGGS